MKNICFLIGNMNYSGGTERVTSLIANELTKNSFNITILSFFEGNQSFFELEADIKLYAIFPSNVSFKKNYFSTILKIRDFVKKNNIHSLILVDSNSYVFTLPALIGLKTKQVCWEHFNFKYNLGKPSRDIARKLAARYCDLVVTLTETDKNFWLNNTKHNNQIISIPNPSPFSVKTSPVNTNNKTVIATGRLAHQKGFDLLLMAWIKVSRANPDWQLIIVGEGEERYELENFIVNNELSSSVTLTGNTNDVSKYYEKADIFCLSSRFEGFGMVLIEALSFGLPIVSFDCEVGPSEILSKTGSILVPPEDIEELSLSLIELMNDDIRRAEIRKDSLIKAKTYQIDKIIGDWIAILT